MKFKITLTLLIALLTMGCDNLMDENQSQLKKPELISMIMIPPEAGPGELVTATFLFADEKGIIEDFTSIWLPGSMDKSSSEEENTNSANSFFEDLAKQGLTPDDLINFEFTFRTRDKSYYEFNEEGLALESLMLVIPKEPTNIEDMTLEGLEALLTPEKSVLGMRSLIISTRSGEDKNKNPEINKLTYKEDENSIENNLVMATSYDNNILTSRQIAADNPVTIKEMQEVILTVHLEKDENEDEILYQWISTGGDFKELRNKEQPFIAPLYREPGESEEDQTGQENVKARKDPNLHPVWLIVRDNGIENQQGQSWFEFYVRIEKDPDLDTKK